MRRRWHNFPWTSQEPFPVLPVDRKNVNLSVLTKLKDYLPCTPVELKGYKKMINLPDWLVWHSIPVKSKKRFSGDALYVQESGRFSGVQKKAVCHTVQPADLHHQSSHRIAKRDLCDGGNCERMTNRCIRWQNKEREKLATTIRPQTSIATDRYNKKCQNQRR